MTTQLDKTWPITGASGGFGFAVAEQLLTPGDGVAVGLQAHRGAPQKVARAMTACADLPQAPRRLALDGACAARHWAPTARLAAVEAQQAIGLSTGLGCSPDRSLT
ncbi:hypothetical protein [Pseudorhodoferax sp. Leaf265]|uniref:hypothetical protein n=1 Tax=Pseudorhodoferax sp. Leaf265 TaxID=1736315 RepID=UPI0006F2E7FE|nr:hypothetical protein [Pseudorhodoferax sp. Leaf265]KQP19275.1 hypothetical protein ASF45_24640 [Pseudorhodoferax sp. Leaf265]